jgi:hypothetical protein
VAGRRIAYISLSKDNNKKILVFFFCFAPLPNRKQKNIFFFFVYLAQYLIGGAAWHRHYS